MGTSITTQSNEAACRTQTARRPHQRILAALLAAGLSLTGALGATSARAFADGTGTVADADTTTMYRMYNPHSSEHFYTASTTERDSLSDNGWTYEGIGWVAPTTSSTPVYRLYNPNAGIHHYTTDANEKDVLTDKGWNDEGIGWYSANENATPVYRQYNPNSPNGQHNYTWNENEKNALLSAGWQNENIAWYAASTGSDISVDIDDYLSRNAYGTLSGDVTLVGSGTGFHAKLVMHCNQPNTDTISFGVQYDTRMDPTKPQVNHTTFLIEQATPRSAQYYYFDGSSIGITPEVGKTYHLQMTWSQDGQLRCYVNNRFLTSIGVSLSPTLIFQVEGSARLNGDHVDAQFDNLVAGNGIQGQTPDSKLGTYSNWSDHFSNFEGLTVSMSKQGTAMGAGRYRTNGATSYKASLHVGGTSTSPAGVDWDNCGAIQGHPLSALAMLPANG